MERFPRTIVLVDDRALARGVLCRAMEMSAQTPIVFVVDDDSAQRESLARLIVCAGWRPESFSCAHDFLARPCAEVPSCLVLDVGLPELGGLELQRQISAERADLPIVCITGHGDVPMAVRAMKAGAVEFFTKPVDGDAILTAIRYAIELSEGTRDRELELRALRASYLSLTAREREVMAMVVAGMLNKQIGQELGISEITVKAHRGKVMRKMNAGSLAELVRMDGRLHPGVA